MLMKNDLMIMLMIFMEKKREIWFPFSNSSFGKSTRKILWSTNKTIKKQIERILKDMILKLLLELMK